MSEGPIDPAQRRLAERRLLAALRRSGRRAPLRPDVRVDTVVAELHDAEPRRASVHRGRKPLTLTDADLRRIVDEMVASGTLLRSGHRIRLRGPAPALDPIMRERVDEMLATLRAAGVMPPPVVALAARLGVPVTLVGQLRAAGDLVAVAPRIDYPRQTWDEITRRLDRLAVEGRLSVGLVRDELGTARRHAEAILRHRARRPA
ncbi:MAG: hypothetical protein WD116_00600 [Chloroflexota bacterium]